MKTEYDDPESEVMRLARQVLRLEAICRRLSEALQTIEDRCGASGNSRHDLLIRTIAHKALHPEGEEGHEN